MIEVKTYQPIVDIVPVDELNVWFESCEKQVETLRRNTPEEVCNFIEAVADKLDTLATSSRTAESFLGKDLLLCGMTNWKGEPIIAERLYPLQVPRLVRVDHRLSMLRFYHRRGLRSLVDWCKARCKEGHGLSALIAVFEDQVMHLDVVGKLNTKAA